MQRVLLPQRRDRPHHRGGVAGVDGRRILPAVDQQDGLRVVQRQEVFLSEAAPLRPDGGDGPAVGHLPDEFPGAAVHAGAAKIHGDSQDPSSVGAETGGSSSSPPASPGALLRFRFSQTARSVSYTC